MISNKIVASVAVAIMMSVCIAPMMAEGSDGATAIRSAETAVYEGTFEKISGTYVNAFYNSFYFLEGSDNHKAMMAYFDAGMPLYGDNFHPAPQESSRQWPHGAIVGLRHTAWWAAAAIVVVLVVNVALHTGNDSEIAAPQSAQGTASTPTKSSAASVAEASIAATTVHATHRTAPKATAHTIKRCASHRNRRNAEATRLHRRLEFRQRWLGHILHGCLWRAQPSERWRGTCRR